MATVQEYNAALVRVTALRGMVAQLQGILLNIQTSRANREAGKQAMMSPAADASRVGPGSPAGQSPLPEPLGSQSGLDSAPAVDTSGEALLTQMQPGGTDWVRQAQEAAASRARHEAHGAEADIAMLGKVGPDQSGGILSAILGPDLAATAQNFAKLPLTMPAGMVQAAGQVATLAASGQTAEAIKTGTDALAGLVPGQGIVLWVKSMSGDPQAREAFRGMEFAPILDVLAFAGLHGALADRGLTPNLAGDVAGLVQNGLPIDTPVPPNRSLAVIPKQETGPAALSVIPGAGMDLAAMLKRGAPTDVNPIDQLQIAGPPERPALPAPDVNFTMSEPPLRGRITDRAWPPSGQDRVIPEVSLDRVGYTFDPNNPTADPMTVFPSSPIDEMMGTRPSGPLAAAAEAARQRLSKRAGDQLSSLSMGFDPLEAGKTVADYAIIASHHIQQGVSSLPDLTEKMVGEFGDHVRAMMPSIYVSAHDRVRYSEAPQIVDEAMGLIHSYQSPQELRPTGGAMSPMEKGMYGSIRQQRSDLRAQFNADQAALPKEQRLNPEAKATALKTKIDAAGLSGDAVRDFVMKGMAGEALQRKIGVRAVRGGVRPMVRGTGFFTPTELLKDPLHEISRTVGGGTGTKTPFMLAQEMDGPLTMPEKLKLPNQMGPMDYFLNLRTRKLGVLKGNWLRRQELGADAIVQDLTPAEEKLVTQILSPIREMVNGQVRERLWTTEELAAVPGKVQVAAREARTYFDSGLDQLNKMRVQRGAAPIQYRRGYTPDILLRQSLYEQLFGDRNPDLASSPTVPDFVSPSPNEVFNPRALPKNAVLPENVREMNISSLMKMWSESSARDMFDTPVLQNAKAISAGLRERGLPNAATAIDEHFARAYGGVATGLDRAFNLDKPGTIRTLLQKYRSLRATAALGLNLKWLLSTQLPSGIAMPLAYLKPGSLLHGFRETFNGEASALADMESSYPLSIKARSEGRYSRQDVSSGGWHAARTKAGQALDTGLDAVNYFMDGSEYFLTRWTYKSALHDGASRGLKGDALQSYAEDVAMKTQQMYDRANLPGLLQSEAFKTVAPWQTFAYQFWNNMKEFGGKTGLPPETFQARAKFALKFLAGMTTANMISHMMSGRSSFDIGSMVPLWDYVGAPVVAGLQGNDPGSAAQRATGAPTQMAIELSVALHHGLQTGDFSKWVEGLVNHFGLGQATRMYEGVRAVAAGQVVDGAGRPLFPITGPLEQARSVALGPYGTEAGIDYRADQSSSAGEWISRKVLGPVGAQVAEAVPVLGSMVEADRTPAGQYHQWDILAARKTKKFQERMAKLVAAGDGRAIDALVIDYAAEMNAIATEKSRLSDVYGPMGVRKYSGQLPQGSETR